MFATVLGLYPRPAGVSDDAAAELALRDQLDAGLGMLSDGVVRQLVTASRQEETDRIVDAWRFADATVRALVADLEPGIEPPLVKACLVGPYSAGGAAGGRAGDSAAARRRTTLESAEALNVLVADLFRAGVPVVQLAEDGLTEIGAGDSDERALAAEALRRATAGVSGHLSLSVAGGNADACGASLFFDLPFASCAFDLILGPDNWRLITQAPQDRGIVCGVADARTTQADTEAVMIWAARYAASSNGRGLERVGLAPSAGLEHLPREVARAKLLGLAEAARKAGLPGAELARQIDPRAIDARSAALGHFDAEATARLGRRRPGRQTSLEKP